MKKLFVTLVCAFLVACAGTPQNPAQTVYQAEQAYTAAATVALAYKQLPPCPQATKLCSSAPVVLKIQAADALAYDLLVKAEAAVRAGGSNTDVAITLALEAIKTLASVTSSLGVK